MKKFILFACLAITTAILTSCNDVETFAGKRDKENAAIAKFISGDTTTIASKLFAKPIHVISEIDFENAGCKTDTASNEFVLFEQSGVYMQIVREGCGEKLESGQTATVLCRFDEYNILTDSLQLSNNNIYFQHIPDKMTVTNMYGTFTGMFDNKSSIMAAAYQSTSVPGGWLIPLRYIKLGRQSKPDEEIAKVRVIVPSAQGHSYASANTYPCYYEITYQRGQ